MQIKLIITLIILLFIISPAIAEDAITDFTTIIPMPSGSIIAGSTYQTEYTFTGTLATEIEINFTVSAPEVTLFSLSPPSVNHSDWTVFYVLNTQVIIPTEEYPGHFTGNTSMMPDDYTLIIVFESIPNIVPGTYEFDISIKADEVIINIPEDDDDDRRGSSRSYGNWTITGPTPLGTLAPTPEPTPVPTVIVHQTTGNGTIITIIPDDPTNYWWYLLIPLFLILILVYLYWKKKSEEDKEGVK